MSNAVAILTFLLALTLALGVLIWIFIRGRRDIAAALRGETMEERRLRRELESIRRQLARSGNLDKMRARFESECG